MLLVERAVRRKSVIDKQIRSLKSELRKLPNGNIHCRRRGKYWRWYVTRNGYESSLSKIKDIGIAQRLAYKCRLQNQIEQLEIESTALDILIKILTTPVEKIDSTFIGRKSNLTLKRVIGHIDFDKFDNPEIKRLADEYYRIRYPVQADFGNKMNQLMEENIQEFCGKPIDVEQYPYVSAYGLRFRSKSEELIYGCLRQHGLLVLYEKDLVLGNGKSKSPDFTIIDPATNREIIWEHFGMMDDSFYLYKNKRKIMEYLDNGYVPNINFIATFETKTQPLDMQFIETLIEYYFE